MANLKISQLPAAAVPTVNDLLAAVNGGTTSKITIQDIINLVPSSSFTGNTSGTCISDIYVTNLHSCSPINFFEGDTPLATFNATDGFKLVSGINMVVPTGSEIVDGGGDTLVSEGSTTNKYSADGRTGTASGYWGGDIYRTVVSGTSTGLTATTIFERQYNYDVGAQIFSYNNGTNDFRVGGAIDGCCVRPVDHPEYCGPCDSPKAVLSDYRYDDSLNGTGAYFAEKYDFIDGTRRSILHWGDADGNDLDCDVHDSHIIYSKTGLLRSDVISGDSSGFTATTKHVIDYELGEGIKSESRYSVVGGTPSLTYQYSVGDRKVDATGMFSARIGGSDVLNQRGGIWNCCYDSSGCPPGTITKSTSPCKSSLSSDVSSLRVGSYINEADDKTLYTIDTANINSGLYSSGLLHSDYSTSLYTETLWDSSYISESKIAAAVNYDTIVSSKLFNTTDLISREVYSASTTGTTSATTASYERKYDLGEGVDSYTSRKHEMSKDNVYQYSTGYKTSSNSWTDFVINTVNTDWLDTLDANCVIAPVCDGSAVNVKSAVVDATDDTAGYIIEGYNPTLKINYKVQAADASSNLLVDFINVNTGAERKIFGTDSYNMYYSHRQKVDEDDLLDRITFSGVSTGYTGTTVFFREERDMKAGTHTNMIDDVPMTTLSVDGLSVKEKLTSEAGEFNFGSLSGGHIPTGTGDSTGSDGDMVSDGIYLYVKRGGEWRRATLSTF